MPSWNLSEMEGNEQLDNFTPSMSQFVFDLLYVILEEKGIEKFKNVAEESESKIGEKLDYIQVASTYVVSRLSEKFLFTPKFSDSKFINKQYLVLFISTIWS